MTLILSHVSHLGVFQVADRLVVTRSGQRAIPFDTQSNKSILFAPRDAVVSIAYTGLSYLDRMPTDQWIVEALQGEQVHLGPDGTRPAAMTSRWRKAWPQLGEAIERLRISLPEAFRRLPEKWRCEGLSVVVAGWQLYRRKRPRPFLQIVSKSAGSSDFELARWPRHIGPNGHFAVLPDSHLSIQEAKALEVAVSGKNDPSGRMRLLIEAVRGVADRSEVVGRDCMCTFLPPVWVGKAWVDYVSPEIPIGAVLTPGQTMRFSATFSPWVITRGLVLAPALLGGPGATHTGLGPYMVRMSGPRARGPQPLAVLASQRRPRSPS